jgi:hypothetical protein
MGGGCTGLQEETELLLENSPSRELVQELGEVVLVQEVQEGGEVVLAVAVAAQC